MSGAGHDSAAAANGYRPNRVRGPLNAAGLAVLDRRINRLLGERKRRLFAGLPESVVELGPGVGANFGYLRRGTEVIAIEPNPAMHPRLCRRAADSGLRLELRDIVAERIDLPDESADAVICTLVLCSVADPQQVLQQIRRVLRPGGRFAFIEHVVAPSGTATRRVQRAVRRPWAWLIEGCSCERDTAALIEQAGFARVDIERYSLRSPLIPLNPQIAGVAIK